MKTAIATLEVGVDNDRPEHANIVHGLFSSGTAFRENRGVYRGTSGRLGAAVEKKTSECGDILETGI